MKNINSMFKRIYGESLYNDVSDYVSRTTNCEIDDVSLSLSLTCFLEDNADIYDTVVFTTQAFGVYAFSFLKEGNYVFTGTDWRYICCDITELVEYYEVLVSRNEIRRCEGIELFSAEKALIKSPEFLRVYGEELTMLLCHQFDDYYKVNDDSLTDMLHNCIRNGNVANFKTRYIFASDIHNQEDHSYDHYLHGIPLCVVYKPGVYVQLSSGKWRYVVEDLKELKTYSKKFISD